MNAKQTEFGVTYSEMNIDHGYPQIHRYTWIISTDGETECDVLDWANDNLMKSPPYKQEQWEKIARTPETIKERNKGFYQLQKHSGNEWEYTVGMYEAGFNPEQPELMADDEFLGVLNDISHHCLHDDPFKRLHIFLSPDIFTTEELKAATKSQMDFAFRYGAEYVLSQIGFFLRHRGLKKMK